MECGVTPIVDLCETDPSECKVSEICGKATTESAGQIGWDYSAAGHVALAKEYGLGCNVSEETALAKSSCSKETPEVCSTKALCSRASQVSGNSKIWKKISGKAYVKEAKRRGLDCGVSEAQTPSVKKDCSASKPELCDQATICQFATSQTGSVVSWTRTSILQGYIKEAKKRGLDCGVIGPKPLAPGELPKCENVSSGKCYGELQFTGGQYYVGEIAYPSKRSGLGINVFPNGHYWVGTWNGNNMSKGYRANTKNRDMNKNFYALGTDQRRKIQLNLKSLGYYKGKVDGLLGTQTMLAGAKYLARQKGHAYFKKLIEDDTSSYFYLDIINHNRTTATTTQPTYVSTKFDRSDFLNLSSLKRKQLQYGLKNLGYYSSSIDGAYGPRTEKAVRDYARSKGINSGYPNSVYRRIVSEVNVPNSFAVAQRPTTSSSSGSSSPSAGSNFLKKLVGGLIVVGVCSTTPNAEACLDGALDTAAGSNSNNGSSRSSPNTSPSSSSASSDKQCNYDFDCSYGEKCIKNRYGKSMCVAFRDSKGSIVRSGNREPQQCSSNQDCSSGYKCDWDFKICLKR